MEALLDPKLGITVLLSTQIVMFVGKFIFDLLKKKNAATDKQLAQLSTLLTKHGQEMKELGLYVAQLQAELKEIKKIKTDINNLFTSVKVIGGPAKWQEIARMIRSDVSIKGSGE